MNLFWVGFIGWLVIIAATIGLNWYRIEKLRSKPHYFGSNWSRSIFGFACVVLMTADTGFDPAYIDTWREAMPSAGYVGSSFYLFFDPGLNVARRKDLDYRGKNSGWLDKLPKLAYYVLKLITLAVLIFSLTQIFPR